MNPTFKLLLTTVFGDNVIFFQMYGEKIEENEELRLDLLDVKEMYKAQVKILFFRVSFVSNIEVVFFCRSTT